jgi:alpha-tubulin suppressor-like RCC1 family protein
VNPNPLLDLNVLGAMKGRVHQIAFGRYHKVAVVEGGRVFSWIFGHRHKDQVTLGQLGQHPQTADLNHPQAIPHLANERVQSVACGDDFTLALTSDGKVFSWGDNNCGQLGITSDGEVEWISEPTSVKGPWGGVAGVAAGGEFACCWTKQGDLFAWGNGERGQIGQEGFDNVAWEPIKVLSVVLKILSNNNTSVP